VLLVLIEVEMLVELEVLEVETLLLVLEVLVD
jgi:hypothetical protein